MSSKERRWPGLWEVGIVGSGRPHATFPPFVQLCIYMLLPRSCLDNIGQPIYLLTPPKQQEATQSLACVFIGEFVLFPQGRPWETRFRELEAFVEEHERLPRRFRADEAETQLGFWLNSQGKRVTSQQIPSRQLEKLRTARSDLIRRRAEGWITGDPDGCFEENCRELREYIEMNGELPRCTPSESDSSAFRLATWLRNLRANGARAMPERRKMLEEVHPLVKELLQKWDDSPLKINRVKWEEDLEKVLDIVEQHGRLPKAKTEKPEYHWLWRQLRRLDTLPPELEKRLRGSHPLVAEAARRSEQKAKGTKA